MLQQWRTISVTETAFVYEVEARPLSQLSACTNCVEPARALQPHGTQRQTIKDAPVRGKHVHINFTRQRYRCANCKRILLQPLFEVSKRRRATERLVDLIGAEAFRKSFSMVSEETGFSRKSVANIFTERVLKVAKSVRPETPRVLGLDEFFVKRKARCVLTDLKARQLFEILPAADMMTLSHFLLQMPQRDQVEVVVMDFRHSYLEVISRLLPQATVVINKWHVLQLAQQAALKVLKKARERSTASQPLRLRYSLYLRNGSAGLFS